MARKNCPFVQLVVLGMLSVQGVHAQPLAWSTAMTNAEQSRSKGDVRNEERSLKQAVALAEKYGQTDIRLCKSLSRLSAFYYERGELVAAEPVLRRQITVVQNLYGAPGTTSGSLIVPLSRLGIVCNRTFKFAEAAKHLSACLELLNRIPASERTVGDLYLQRDIGRELGDTYRGQRKWQLAAAAYDQACRAAEAVEPSATNKASLHEILLYKVECLVLLADNKQALSVLRFAQSVAKSAGTVPPAYRLLEAALSYCALSGVGDTVQAQASWQVLRALPAKSETICLVRDLASVLDKKRSGALLTAVGVQ